MKADLIGLVFTIYLSSTPIPVREFINKIHFKPEQYLFAVTANCGYPGKLEYYLERLLAKRGKRLDFYHALKMASNSPKGLQPSFYDCPELGEHHNRKEHFSLGRECVKRTGYNRQSNYQSRKEYW